MVKALPDSHATIVGPDNCPRCKAEKRAADYQAEIDTHVHGPACGDPYVRFGMTRYPHCTLGWYPTVRSSVRAHLARTLYAASTMQHHCQPHRCSLGRNCGSYVL